MGTEIIALGLRAGELWQLAVGVAGAFLGPYFAVRVTQRLATKQREREAKLGVFKALLSTHHLLGDPTFSAAINLARIEFIDHAPVVGALDDFLRSARQTRTEANAEALNVESQRRMHLLLREMAQALRLPLSEENFRIGGYAADALIRRDAIALEAQLAWPRIAASLEQQTAILQGQPEQNPAEALPPSPPPGRA